MGVFNDRGTFHRQARVTEEVPPGVIVMGHSPTFSDNLVEVGLAG